MDLFRARATVAAAIVALTAFVLAGPADGASSRAKTLYSVEQRLSLGNCGPGASIAALDTSSLFLTGTFSCGRVKPADLIRVNRVTFKVVARIWLPAMTSVAYGDNALWWATGAPEGNAGTSLTPGHGKLLLKLNPNSLGVTSRFVLPEATQIVTVVNGNLWVATPTNLFRLDPSTGAITRAVHLEFTPTALAGSYDGRRLYVLGATRTSGHLVMSVFSANSGELLGVRRSTNFSDGPIAVVREGVWIPVQSTVTKSTTVRLLEGTKFVSHHSLTGYSFDTIAYIGGGAIWLIDAAGVGPTVCASPNDGAVRARGRPVGVEYGAMAFEGGSAYLLRMSGLNQSLLQIRPSRTCSH